jgi:hypothetical protein
VTNHPIVPYPSLLPELHKLIDSGALGKLWADESAWQSLSIDYHLPRVERLYANLPNGHRVSLHRIHPCEPNKALWHSHPWPSAVLVLVGKYEHSTGFVDRNGLHCSSRSILGAGASYEIVDPLAWHSVRPIDGPAYSVMLTGKLWPASKVSAPKPAPQRPLTAEEIADLRRVFDDLLGWERPASVVDFAKRTPFEIDIINAHVEAVEETDA